MVALDHETMMKEAEKLRKIADNVCIKVPSIDGLKTCKALTGEGTMVNVTLCLRKSENTCARTLFLLCQRHDDNASVMEPLKIFLIYDNYIFDTEILVLQCDTQHMFLKVRGGADVMTAPPKVIKALFNHVLTEKRLGFPRRWQLGNQFSNNRSHCWLNKHLLIS